MAIENLTIAGTFVLVTNCDDRRAAIVAQLDDGTGVHLWLSEAQIKMAILGFQRTARDLGIEWPKPLNQN